MTSPSARRILTVNTGSSSVKAALFRTGDAERREATIGIERVGHPDGALSVHDADGNVLLDRRQDLPDHPAALAALLACLRETDLDAGLAAIGHRVVHGGRDYAVAAVLSSSMRIG